MTLFAYITSVFPSFDSSSMRSIDIVLKSAPLRLPLLQRNTVANCS